MATIQTDLLVIGAGLAGERVAITAAAAGHAVTLLSLVPPRRSHSSAAQGGMQAALGNCAMGLGDCTDVHFADTVKGSDWGCEQDVARLFVETAPVAVREMAAWGVPWNRVVPGRKRLPSGLEVEDLPEKEGLITARDFGGTQKWRTVYTSDGTGHTLLYAMDNIVVKLGVTVHDRREAIALIHDGGRCLGAVVRNLVDGALDAYLARATVIATGGYGQIYGTSTNAIVCEGTGMAIAQDTGVVPLGNMEAVQFHPTGIIATNILVTEGCRGDGGYLVDRNEHRFMPDYEPVKKDLASRDVVSRRMTQHIRKGLGVDSPWGPHLWLDIRHLGERHIATYLREVQEICRNFLGIDPVHQLIPVRPTQHYSMGGVRTNIDGAAHGLQGLFAVGETACWDLHGFNRLGGNSLAETVVAGRIIGERVAAYLAGAEATYPSAVVRDAISRQHARIRALGAGSENVYALRREMERTLMSHVGIFRDGAALQKAVDALAELLRRARNLGLRGGASAGSPELTAALRLPGMLRLAQSIAYGALQRTESRGSHHREDFPQRDDANWLKRTLAFWDEGATVPRLAYEPVTITELPPGDRGYGEASKKGT
jgi:fumarate reductase flavoprotein subunit